MNAHALHAADLAPVVPPVSLVEARALREALAGLLARERALAADFLVALADFDLRRGWEALGHASLFAFLHRELGLSKGAAYLRFTAARLLPRYPEVEDALRDGRLCLSAVGELARVLTVENRAEVLPRFFGCSSREAREVAAALAPRPAAPRREVVTVVRASETRTGDVARQSLAFPAPGVAPGLREDAALGLALASPPGSSGAVRAHELALTQPARVARSEEVEPLDADLRRLHLTVSRRLLEKVAVAKDALAHSLPGATTEQVLEAALDVLLEKQARRRGLVRRPRTTAAARPNPASATTSPSSPAAPEPPTSTSSPTTPAAQLASTTPSTLTIPTTPGHRSLIPAATRRDVWLRDAGRCQYPLDPGGTCGTTRCLQLDHVVPLALGGESTPANLRVVCAQHNRLAARLALGQAAAQRRWRR